MRTQEQARRYETKKRLKIRAQVIEAYGARCNCCGESKLEFLTLDHMNNDGAKHLKELNGCRGMIYWDVKRQGFPKDKYQLMCYNCNCGRYRNGGICPHKTNYIQDGCEFTKE